MLPAAAALALATYDDAAMALVEATPADAVGADGRAPLHHAAAFARSAALAQRLLAFEPVWAKRVDAGGKLPIELLLAQGDTYDDDLAMALVEATPADAVGADGRTPLHHAAAFARSAALVRRLLAFEPVWACLLYTSPSPRDRG